MHILGSHDPADPRDPWWEPFTARLINETLSPDDGVSAYSWKEVERVPSSGDAYADVPGGRTGSYAFERNGAGVLVSQTDPDQRPVVLLRFAGVRSGRATYDFDAPACYARCT